MSVSSPLWRDANHSPIQVGGVVSRSSKILSANNTTANVPIFGITGAVNIVSLYGIVTTDLGANNTAAYWRLNDQTAQVNITLNTGTTISAVKAGSVIVKKGLAAAALTLLDNAAGKVSEPTTLETTFFSPFVAVQKTGATTNIEFVYSTTDAPTSGAIQFFAVWLPVSADGKVVAV